MATSEERRARWQRSVDHKLAHGLHVETDPGFLVWIEEWIAGEVSIKEVQQRYGALILSRDKTGIVADDKVAAALMDDIRQEFPEVGDIGNRRSSERKKAPRAIDDAWHIDDEPDNEQH